MASFMEESVILRHELHSLARSKRSLRWQVGSSHWHSWALSLSLELPWVGTDLILLRTYLEGVVEWVCREPPDDMCKEEEEEGTQAEGAWPPGRPQERAVLTATPGPESEPQSASLGAPQGRLLFCVPGCVSASTLSVCAGEACP